jgi:hypothetical protein
MRFFLFYFCQHLFWLVPGTTSRKASGAAVRQGVRFISEKELLKDLVRLKKAIRE